MYLHENYFYGWAMNQCLPHSEFKWLNQGEVNNFGANLIEENSPIGYLLEIDLKYPYMNCIMIIH